MVNIQAPEYPFRRTGKRDRLKEITISGEELFALEARGISPTFIDWARVREVLLSEYAFHTERSLGGLTARDALHMLRARKPDLLIYGEGANGDGAPLTDSQWGHVFFARNIHKIKAAGCSERAAVQFASLLDDWRLDGFNPLCERTEGLFDISVCLHQHSGLGWLNALETVIEHEWLLRLKARTAENAQASQRRPSREDMSSLADSIADRVVSRLGASDRSAEGIALEGLVCVLSGERHALTEEQAKVVRALLDARGEIKSSADMAPGQRVDRIVNKLPDKIARHIERVKGRGYCWTGPLSTRP